MIVKMVIFFLSMLLGITSYAQQPVVAARDTVVVRDTVFVYVQHPGTSKKKHTNNSTKERDLYAKTNAVGLTMLVLNAAAEYKFLNDWSVCLPIYWSGWDFFRSDMKFRCFLVQPEIRYWGIPVKGLFAGAHLGTGWYNYTLPSMDYRYQDKDGSTPLFNAGISVGYRHSLGHWQRWMIEYSLGVGYVSTSYDRFFNVPNGQLVDNHRKNLFLIDQLNVSLVYHIPLKKKGGAR